MSHYLQITMIGSFTSFDMITGITYGTYGSNIGSAYWMSGLRQRLVSARIFGGSTMPLTSRQ
jgi:hypothetical protein